MFLWVKRLDSSRNFLCTTVCLKVSKNFKFLQIFQVITKLFWIKLSCDWLVEKWDSNKTCSDKTVLFTLPMHIGALCKFPFRWIYHCHSSKSIAKETGKMYLCAMYDFLGSFERVCYSRVGIIGGNEVTIIETKCFEYSIKLKPFLIISYTVYRSSCQLRPPLRGPFRCSIFCKLN